MWSCTARPPLNRDVLHRIRHVDANGRLTLRGDNNNFSDPDHPSRGDVYGRLAFVVPGVGNLPGVGSRSVAAIAICALLLLSAQLWFGGATHRDREGEAVTPFADDSRPIGTAAVTASMFRSWVAAASLATLMAAVGVWFWAGSLPNGAAVAGASGAPTSKSGLRHTGVFAYSGVEANRADQDDRKVSTGDAVFTKSTRTLDLRFDYQLQGDGAASAQGAATWEYLLEDDNGWRVRSQLGTASVAGGRATIRAKLNLEQLRERTRAFERATGSTSALYRIRLRPRVKLGEQGPSAARGQAFAPELTLIMDTLRVRPETLSGGEAQAQYHPSEAIGAADSSAQGAPPAARPRVTRTVGRALAFLVLALGAAGVAYFASSPSHPVSRRSSSTSQRPMRCRPWSR